MKFAKKIVGKSEGLKAAEKLANWVGKNIYQESHSGFFQSPADTLKRRRGNCCSQTDLFLQMCHAVGVTKNHKVCYVHVGTVNYKSRHFFALIDNLCIDVNSKPNHPWGHASVLRDVFTITEYPMLPLVKEY